MMMMRMQQQQPEPQPVESRPPHAGKRDLKQRTAEMFRRDRVPTSAPASRHTTSKESGDANRRNTIVVVSVVPVVGLVVEAMVGPTTKTVEWWTNTRNCYYYLLPVAAELGRRTKTAMSLFQDPTVVQVYWKPGDATPNCAAKDADPPLRVFVGPGYWRPAVGFGREIATNAEEKEVPTTEEGAPVGG